MKAITVIRRCTSYGALPLVAVLASAPAAAAPWEFNPSVEAGLMFDDNYKLTPAGTEIDVQGPVVDAALEMRTLTQTGEFSFTPRVRATYFPDETDLDGVDYFGTLDWQHRGQRVHTNIRADYSQQDIVNSEQPDAGTGGGDLGEPDIGDSGITFVDNRRRRATLRPSVNFDVSQRNELQFGVGYTDVSFERQVVNAQENFSVTDLVAGLSSRVNETSSLITRLRSARYDIESQEVTNGYGAELEWNRRTVADTRSYFRAGAQNVELQNGKTETAWIAGAGVEFLAGRNELFADLSRNVGPSSAGAVITRNQLRVRWTYALTPRLSLLAGLRGTYDEDVDPEATFQPRRYATGDVGLQWFWQEEFSLRAAYD
ncbi:MAG TPA: hypothetical protein VNM71_01530, partial [Steroidobacteraceae bacterium]|nr:hypothetical protein [Steroidobacteraceae bacterium]